MYLWSCHFTGPSLSPASPMPVLHLCIIRPLMGRTETFLLHCLISISFVHAKQQLMNASLFSLPLSRKGCVFQFQGEKPIIPKQLKRFVSEHKQTKAVRREHGKCFSLEQQFLHMPPGPSGPAVASAAVHPGANFRWWESTSWGWREWVHGSKGHCSSQDTLSLSLLGGVWGWAR